LAATVFFSAEGREAYLVDLPEAEIHRLETGHFAIEDHAEYIDEGTEVLGEGKLYLRF